MRNIKNKIIIMLFLATFVILLYFNGCNADSKITSIPGKTSEMPMKTPNEIMKKFLVELDEVEDIAQIEEMEDQIEAARFFAPKPEGILWLEDIVLVNEVGDVYGQNLLTHIEFVFDDGVTIRRALDLTPCLYQKIEYADVTGDMSSEVILYTYFANTATEYSSLYIYEIKKGRTMQLFPTDDIAEIAQDACDTEIVDVIADGRNRKGLMIRTYYKENGIADVEDSVIIYYDEEAGRWSKVTDSYSEADRNVASEHLEQLKLRNITLENEEGEYYYHGGITGINFHFTDGATVKKEVDGDREDLMEIDYHDLTGDGIEEVLFYMNREEAGLTYHPVYIYEIGAGEVTEIFPAGMLDSVKDVNDANDVNTVHDSNEINDSNEIKDVNMIDVYWQGSYRSGIVLDIYSNSGEVELMDSFIAIYQDQQWHRLEYPEDDILSHLNGLTFIFSSGAGGWSTEVEMKENGSFEGVYYDWDLGVTGDDYPNGSCYLSAFTGQFTDAVKIDDETWSLKLGVLEIVPEMKDKMYSEEITDGYRYTYVDPYGLENAEEFILYLPGRTIDEEVPEMFLSWVSIAWWWHTVPPRYLPCYGLYNVSGEAGFCTSIFTN